MAQDLIKTLKMVLIHQGDYSVGLEEYRDEFEVLLYEDKTIIKPLEHDKFSTIPTIELQVGMDKYEIKKIEETIAGYVADVKTDTLIESERLKKLEHEESMEVFKRFNEEQSQNW